MVAVHAVGDAMSALAGQLRALLEAHSALLWGLAASSVLMVVVSLVAVPFLVLRMREDYYIRPGPPRLLDRHPLVRASVLVARNTVGAVLLAAGIAMLFLPGQGLLTILLALALLDFRGKHAAERWLVSRPQVIGSLNWLRTRAGRPPLRLP